MPNGKNISEGCKKVIEIIGLSYERVREIVVVASQRASIAEETLAQDRHRYAEFDQKLKESFAAGFVADNTNPNPEGGPIRKLEQN